MGDKGATLKSEPSDVLCNCKKALQGNCLRLGLQGRLCNRADRHSGGCVHMRTILKLHVPLPCEWYNVDSCSPDQRAG